MSDPYDDYRARYPDDDLPRDVFETLRAVYTFGGIHEWYITPPTRLSPDVRGGTDE